MRITLLNEIKSKIELRLRDFLCEEGIKLHVAANDNFSPQNTPAVALEAIEDRPLQGSLLLSEIKVTLSVLGKPWQCETLVNGIYEALHPHAINHSELTVLLMCLHVESLYCARPRHFRKRAVMRYIVEENASASTEETAEAAKLNKAEA
jgi:hypothetical protein